MATQILERLERNATEADADAAIVLLKRAINAAENSNQAGENAVVRAAAALSAAPCGWRAIETAPRDGSEILAWADQYGIVLVRWTSAAEFLTDAEMADWDEDAAHKEDWFCADFVCGTRLENDCLPTHWHPLPAVPRIAG